MIELNRRILKIMEKNIDFFEYLNFFNCFNNCIYSTFKRSIVVKIKEIKDSVHKFFGSGSSRNYYVLILGSIFLSPQ